MKRAGAPQVTTKGLFIQGKMVEVLELPQVTMKDGRLKVNASPQDETAEAEGVPPPLTTKLPG